MTRIRNAPDASALMATARSFGNYDLAGALADIIDNSITARASRIEISCLYEDDQDCTVRIRDNGQGMDCDELRRAMCPASTHPEQQRPSDDLGRFGWGMKSASFSQCRILTVISRRDGELHGARWNLDDIAEWQMDQFGDAEAAGLLRRPFDSPTGTELIWSNCDRLSEGRSLTREQFNDIISDARRKLSQIFHRYLGGDGGKFPRLEIRLNGLPLEETDPFCQKHLATITKPEEPIPIRTDNGTHTVLMQAFVLPHYSKLTAAEYEAFGGDEGYLRSQGFYVYRNRRLIISGTWFGLAKHGELSKLVRVRVDIPNSLDEMWKITVDKSDAQLPSALKSRMKALVNGFRGTSHKVHRSKGAKLDTGGPVPVWHRHVRNGVIRYSINREHPLMDTLVGRLGDTEESALAALLQMIETQVPVDSIGREVEAHSDQIQRGFTSREEVVSFLRLSLPALMVEAGSPAALRELLARTEPFASNMNVVESELKGLISNA